MFGIIGNFTVNTENEDITEGFFHICEKYTDDFKKDFSQEFIQFVACIKMCPIKKIYTETKSIE